MGNAAACKACGSDKGSKTGENDNDLNLNTDYYKAADFGTEVDNLLVRRKGKKVSLLCFTFAALMPLTLVLS